MKLAALSLASAALLSVVSGDACTTYSRISDGVCAEDCLGSMVGICPVALVVKGGSLKKLSCASQGYTKPDGTISQKAGPCGTLTFQKYAKQSVENEIANTIPLVTFNPDDDTFRTFEELNDPVMGGRSTGGFSVKGSVGRRGTVAIVPP